MKTMPEYDPKETEAVLAAFLPEEESLADRLREAMNYSFLAGGKRLRPRLMRLSYEAFGGKGKAVEPFMAAIEMIHSYSLVHDDLPCMDNDTLRRGKPTTWAVYGVDFGTLAGDGLLTYAFETAAKAFACPDADPALVGKAIGILARKAGLYGMCGGQSLDVYLTGKPLDQAQLDFIYRLKTGALLEASLMIGALLSGADEGQLEKIEKLAGDVGYAFQIRDDILDLVSTEAELGKPIGSDEKNGKTTYVSLNGMEKAEAEIRRLTEEAAELLAVYPGDTSELRELLFDMAKRNK